jgi:predicted MFS family arabinose efflux permease
MGILSPKAKEKVQGLAHYLAGLVIILKGVDKVEHFSEHPIITIFLFVMGFFIIFATAKHHYFEKRFKDFKVLMFLCEGITLSIVTYYYFREGKKALPFAYLFATIMYFIMTAVTYTKKTKQQVAD